MEYLNLPAMRTQIMPRLGMILDDPFALTRVEMLAYWERVKQIRTSPNGVFGYKMFKLVFQDIISRYPEVFEDIEPDYVIYLTRNDIVGQAISHSRAIKTKNWFAGFRQTDETYDFEHIAACQKQIEREYDEWEKVFSNSGINPIRVTYEDVLRDERDVIYKILSLMGIEERPESRLPIPLIERQSDSISNQWRTRYESDRLERRPNHFHTDGASQ